MQTIRSAVLYTALALGANTAWGQSALPDPAKLEALKHGDMEKLVLSVRPTEVPDGVLVDDKDAEHHLSDWRGKYIVVNFWATWCAPCRKELGSLDRLEGAMGGERFAVLTIATGPNPLPAIQKFYQTEGIAHLPILRDPTQALARPMGVLALPVSVLIDPEGREIGRLVGDAEWDGPDAKALLAEMTTEK